MLFKHQKPPALLIGSPPCADDNDDMKPKHNNSQEDKKMKHNNTQIKMDHLEKATGGLTSCDPALALASTLATSGLASCDPAIAAVPLASGMFIPPKTAKNEKAQIIWPNMK